MNPKEISQIIIDTCESVNGSFADRQPEMVQSFWKNHKENPIAYRAEWAPNYSYIDCSEAPHLLEFCLTHPAFSHWTHRSRYSVTIYWHDDESPTRVRSVAAFDPKRLPEAYRILKDPIGEAIAWANNDY